MKSSSAAMSFFDLNTNDIDFLVCKIRHYGSSCRSLVYQGLGGPSIVTILI